MNRYYTQVGYPRERGDGTKWNGTIELNYTNRGIKIKKSIRIWLLQ